ncbi:FAD-dependent oxidoreductase [Paenibacillus mesophilus]|uniref:FAD-dependent oxidoreductase n=1 Tax=Paenibacillus mesophilus TaxID=2582849 RepID=UPI00110E8289|nr:FAD-dependent oxidoreductase [Paenibacillus mesophilus]TMV45929.1 FAD-dependent oxidoreductase [Paenibacillus mesophilus]
MKGVGDAIPVYGTYDAIVSGGGLIGIACATALARSGSKVAIVERRSAHGWEIGRARCATAGLERTQADSALVGELTKELARWSRHDGGTRSSVAELLFDRWAMEADVDVMFHGWSSKIALRDGAVAGLIAGTREGYRLLNAPLVIETEDHGRLIDEDYAKTALARKVSRAFHMRNAKVDGTKEIVLPDGHTLLLRSESEGRARADIGLTALDSSGRNLEFHATIPEAVRAIREQVEGCGQAAVYYWAEEEWGGSAFRLEDGFPAEDRPIGHLLEPFNGSLRAAGLTAGDIAISRCKGLVLAGPWLPRYLAASTGQPAAEMQTLSVINRMLLGEAAASLITSRSGEDSQDRIHHL